MSLGNQPFTTNPENVKQYTNPTGDGVSRSDAPQVITGGGNPAPYYEISVKEKPGLGSDTTISHTGPGAGVASGSGGPTDVQGFVSSTGNKILIDNTFGSDTISMQHHSGATVVIDADGSIHIVSTGKKGVAMVAPTGDATVYARGHVIIKGDSKITIESAGDLDFNVGGNLSMHVKGDMHTVVEGSVVEEVDGSKVFEVVKDFSTTIAGDTRITVAGDMNTQVTGDKKINTGGYLSVKSDGAIGIATQDILATTSKGDTTMDSKGKFTVKSTGHMSTSTKGTYDAKSEGLLKLSSKGAAHVHSTGGMQVHAGGIININGASTEIQGGGAASPAATDAPDDPLEAEYAPAELIMDNLTTVRVAPDFQGNAKRMSAESMSAYDNEGNVVNPKAKAAAASNSGGGMVSEVQLSGIEATAPSLSAYDKPLGISPTGRAERNPIPTPTSAGNTNEMISRHYRIGDIRGIRSVPKAQERQVLEQAMNVAWNILDPMKDHFGAQFEITTEGWYRFGTTNHGTGGAVDVRSPRDNHSLTGEMAAWARDNLPYSKILLEKNNYGGIHIHLESALPGQPGGGSVFTCQDPKCSASGRIEGLHLSHATAALKGGKSG